ncbi:hypothetical protein niasHT_008288 [Heterodera trifolii]|uniref:BTB domain-containing protein n=1 Tax=Heterodera trifolii TaxID=157864 RepID=A0ABD2M1C9_9BILA
MSIFDEFVVVDEKAFTNLMIEKGNTCHHHINCLGCANGRTKNVTKFSDLTQFAALEFQFQNANCALEVKDIGNASESDVPLAQIIVWRWNLRGAQTVKDRQTLNIGGTLFFHQFYASSSIIIRILKKRQKDGPNLTPSFLSSPADDDLTVQIGDKKLTVSAHWLTSVSPVVQRMLSVEMREKQQRLITLNDLGVDMEQFKDFVEAISPIALQYPILPNPENVLVLHKLADFFQVDWLKRRCETQLANCVEIPLIDRFLLIEQFGLTNLKNYFLHLNSVDKLRTFFKSNRKKLSSNVFASKELLAEFGISQ